jgi:hypothetical protein
MTCERDRKGRKDDEFDYSRIRSAHYVRHMPSMWKRREYTLLEWVEVLAKSAVSTRLPMNGSAAAKPCPGMKVKRCKLSGRYYTF